MATLSQDAERIINAFGQQPGVTQDHISNLRASLNGSPVLLNQFNDAVAQQHLKQIVPLANANAGGEYDPQALAMRLSLASLTSPQPGSNGQPVPWNAGEVTFVLGHELEHGFNRVATAQALQTFANDAWRIARHDPAPRDYTSTIGNLLAQNRRVEASAEIAGFNASSAAYSRRIQERCRRWRRSTTSSQVG